MRREEPFIVLLIEYHFCQNRDSLQALLRMCMRDCLPFNLSVSQSEKDTEISIDVGKKLSCVYLVLYSAFPIKIFSILIWSTTWIYWSYIDSGYVSIRSPLLS